jgi:hypothetical protein
MVSKRERQFANETKEQPPDFSNTERNHHWKIRRQIGLDRVIGF